MDPVSATITLTDVSGKKKRPVDLEAQVRDSFVFHDITLAFGIRTPGQFCLGLSKEAKTASMKTKV